MTILLILTALLLTWLMVKLAPTTGFKRPARWRREPILAGRKPQPRTVLVTGATGFIGKYLCRHFIEEGDDLWILTRDHARAWDLYGPHARIYTSLEHIRSSDRIDVIINLAGAPIFARRWTATRRRVLSESRLQITEALVDLVARLHIKPQVFINASAVGYYGARDDEELTEADRGRPVFQSQLCQTWELAAQRAGNYAVRVCRLRLGLVLGRQGGALTRFAVAARLRLRTVLGSGGQWISWIHVDDVVRLVEHCIEHRDMCGPVNATAPVAVTQRDFAHALSACFGNSLQVTVPASVLRALLGEMAELLVDGQRVVPLQARCAGFEFRYHRIDTALADLIRSPSADSASSLQPAEILYDALCPVCDAEMTSYCRIARRSGLREPLIYPRRPCDECRTVQG
ncbi:MAG TPA: TIGR01777 family oxidoreductase [Povalibacter sp.]